uniref:Uncharacterized protein n=1 Tax=Ditylenchus dipsaci TaxID=166011 RepID=A0A915D1B3_9BILA
MSVYLQWIIDAWRAFRRSWSKTRSNLVESARQLMEVKMIRSIASSQWSCAGGRSKLKQAREDKELAELLEEIDLEQEQESYE